MLIVEIALELGSAISITPACAGPPITIVPAAPPERPIAAVAAVVPTEPVPPSIKFFVAPVVLPITIVEANAPSAILTAEAA